MTQLLRLRFILHFLVLANTKNFISKVCLVEMDVIIQNSDIWQIFCIRQLKITTAYYSEENSNAIYLQH
ncbi:hypothetical protein BpHYR1_027223 [Brachionus plicatilis]|uniref:Secreted protein n=1 Tax=Brachionus plicatilis TaxID=10195 RepID=A0A3M7T8A5_BRAPC|nr:hypothetical protein BpHYR1_027223 [Brachionus plicatilis]